MTPLTISSASDHAIEGVNVVDVNPRHGLWSFGLDGAGIIEFWDPRSRSSLTKLMLPRNDLLPIQTLNPDSPIAQIPQTLSVTALASHPTDGLSLAVGTSSGHTLLYDLRSSTPFAVKDQGYGEAMKSVEWLRGGGAQEDGGRVVSADSKVIKIWDKTDVSPARILTSAHTESDGSPQPSTNHLSLHPPSPLVDLHPVPASGLLFAACNTAQLSSYYIPEIGPAPKWAGFLDNVTEEMAEDVGGGKGAYSDFKFIDKTELETYVPLSPLSQIEHYANLTLRLGLTHLTGTSALKPYMHGYFLSLKLYTTARLIANPNSYAEHRERVLSDRLAAKAESRIRARKDQPKVNKALAERLRRVEESEKKKSSKKGAEGAVEENEGKTEGGVLVDPRFREVFENPEFEVDEASREFALLNPATVVNNNVSACSAFSGGDTDDLLGQSEKKDRGGG
jgi:ribosome biogenesis protein ENP2